MEGIRKLIKQSNAPQRVVSIKMKTIKILFVILLAPIWLNAQDADYLSRLNNIDKYAEQLLKDWNIPGMGIVIVHKQETIFAKGFGYADLEKGRKATSETIFPIASNTKLFTAVIAAQLATEGKLKLDAPIQTYIPEISFHDGALNSSITMRDLLSHRTGLPGYDGIWINSRFKREDLLAKLSYIKPTLGFREGYIYNNLMYTTAGLVIERVTSKSWEENVQERIFKPLGMNQSGFAGVGRKPSLHSLSYFENSEGKLQSRNFSSQSEALGPAGTIYSSMDDMAKWLTILINQGRYKKKQIIPADAIAETTVPNNISDKKGRYEELSNSIYAMGRYLQTYKGTKIISHTGSIDNFYSNLTYLPQDSLAIFAVHNSASAGTLRSVINLPVIDILLGRQVTDWSNRYRQEYLEERVKDMAENKIAAISQVSGTNHSHLIKAYTGTFHHPVYGNIVISSDEGGLKVNYRDLDTYLDHWHYDQFRSRDDGKGGYSIRLNFLTDNAGNISQIQTRPFGDPETNFTRIE